ncbi:hypothetical protein ACFLUV_06680 [Elusimicrobiota bacterium]
MIKENYRTKNFKEKFASAKKVFNENTLKNIVSFKFREQCVNHSEYDHYLDYISRELNYKVSPIQGGFQGNAFEIIDTEGNKAIIVEHETGLEIFAIIGVVASSITILSALGSAWRYISDRYLDRRPHYHPRHRHGGNGDIEIRQINSKGSLVENNIISVENYILNLHFIENEKLHKKVAQLEKEMKKLKSQPKKIKKAKSVKPKNRK